MRLDEDISARLRCFRRPGDFWSELLAPPSAPLPPPPASPHSIHPGLLRCRHLEGEGSFQILPERHQRHGHPHVHGTPRHYSCCVVAIVVAPRGQSSILTKINNHTWGVVSHYLKLKQVLSCIA